jgi:signal transduction histidine kinase
MASCFLRDTLTRCVTDSGIGIEPAFMPRLFEPFSQQDESTTPACQGLELER